MINITHSFYVKRTIFNTKYPIHSEIKLGEFVFFQSSTLTSYMLIEYNLNDIERLMKLYNVTKSKKLKKLYEFITFCKENETTLDDIMKLKYVI